MLHFRVALLICLYKVKLKREDLRKLINDGEIPVFYWQSNTKEMKQQNRVIIDIKVNELRYKQWGVTPHFSAG